MDTVKLLCSVLLTALMFGSVPMLFLAVKRTVGLPTYKKVCIIWPILLQIAFYFIEEMALDMHEHQYFAAVLWGYVFYRIGKRIIRKRGEVGIYPKSNQEGEKKYYIVDSETGEVVGEKPAEASMKSVALRVSSWLVVVVIEIVFNILSSFYSRFVFWLHSELSAFGTAIYVIALIAAGSTIIGAAFWVTLLGAEFTVEASEKVCKSKKGVRFVVISAIFMFYYALVFLAIIGRVILTDRPVELYLSLAITFLYLFIVATSGWNRDREEKKS